MLRRRRRTRWMGLLVLKGGIGILCRCTLEPAAISQVPAVPIYSRASLRVSTEAVRYYTKELFWPPSFLWLYFLFYLSPISRHRQAVEQTSCFFCSVGSELILCLGSLAVAASIEKAPPAKARARGTLKNYASPRY